MKLRRVVFWCHLTVGVLAGLVILIMSVTGVALAYERQLLEWVASRHAVSRPTADARWLPFDTLMVRAREVAGTTRITTLTVSADSTVPLAVGLENRQTLFSDPYTGRIIGNDSAMRAILLELQHFHRSLGIGSTLRSKVGTAITGACNTAFLFMVLSGIYLWWPRRWSARMLRRIIFVDARARGRARDWNWHHVAGFWCALVLAVIVVSGMFMSYRWPTAVVSRMVGSEPRPDASGPGDGRTPGHDARAGAEGQRRQGAPTPLLVASGQAAAHDRASSDTLWSRVFTRADGWHSIQMRLPPDPGGPVSFIVTTTPNRRPDRRLTLVLDAATGALLETQSYATTERARRIRSWMRPLHTGEAGGVVGQTVAAIASAGAVVHVWTGLSLALRRLRSRRARATRRDTESARSSPALELSTID